MKGGNKLNWRGTPEQRLLKSFKKVGDCWMWTRTKDKNGYGWIQVDQYPMKAHRLSYSLFKGEIPAGFLVCHSCDRPSCINPEHLWLGTPSENSLDREQKGRGRWKKRI